MKSAKRLYIDFETLPTDDPRVIQAISEGITHPGNISKPETIAAWHAEKKPAAIEEAIRKTALDPWFGRILCAGIAIDDGEPTVIRKDTERETLLAVLDALDGLMVDSHEVGHQPAPLVIGHNVAGFDIHYLWVRCVVNGLKAPIWWPVHAKPWDTDRIFDTMAQAAGNKQFMSLSSLCLALGIDSPKGELDGSKIYDFWLAGRLAEIEAYQARDIVATRAVYKRMALISEPA